MAPPDDVAELIELYTTGIDEMARSGSRLSQHHTRSTTSLPNNVKPVTRRAERTKEPDHALAGVHAQLILMGNLPTLATIWLEQYAEQIARQVGPTALLRLEDGECSIAILGGHGSDAQDLELPTEFSGRIGDVVSWLVNHVERVLVVPREHHATDHKALLETRRQILILTGSDDAALVQAYRMMKSLVETAKTNEVPPPRAGLVLVGEKPEYAQRIGACIADTAMRFLGIGLGIESLPAADASHCLCRHQVSVGPTFGVRELLDLLDRTPRALSETPTVEAMPEVAADVDSEPELVEMPAVDDEPEFEVVNEQLEVDLDAVEAECEESSSLNVIDDEEFAELEAAFDSREDLMPPPMAMGTELLSPDSLLAFFPELQPLDFECPVGSDIWLAYDPTDNVLHLVTTEEQLRSLNVARSWAMRNESILRAVLPGVRSFMEGGLQVDLVVQDAAASSDLHGTGIRLYWLMDEHIDGPQIVPLNTEKTAGRGF